MAKSNILKFIGCVAAMITILAGCREKGVVYKYENQDKTAELVISKAEYLENELKLYTNDLKGDYEITAYDADFNEIKEDFITELKKGVLSIKGTGAERISGLYMDGNVRYHLRYLDSNEYAILYEYDATEIGWETYGDYDKYYTEAELAAQNAAKEERQAIQDENFRIIEGTWKCDMDPNLYIKFFEDSDGSRKMEWNRSISDEEYYLDEMYIAVINIVETNKGKEIEILDNPYWGMMMRFNISEDMTQIIDTYYKGEAIYMKEGKSSSANKEGISESASIYNNNGHFAQIGDRVYFHLADEKSMQRGALWAKYADSECGRTVLYEYDLTTDELEAVAYDYTSGVMAAQGGALYSMTYRPSFDGEDYPDSIIGGYSYAYGDMVSDLAFNNDTLIGATMDGSYIIAYHCEYVNKESIQHILVYKDGNLKKTIDVDGYYDIVKLGDSELFYICETKDDNYSLIQLDIISGEKVNLGMLPEFEDSYGGGYVDEAIIEGDNIYFTYSDYQGTGNFFCGGYYVQARIGIGDSLSFTDMPNETDTVAEFAVMDGQMIAAEGTPGTCRVQDNGDLGYFNEKGEWNKVASGWGREYYDEYEDFTGVELAELVGDYIFLYYNDNVRAPMDDVGWRYAYSRNYTEVYRISIKTGETKRLINQVSTK